ncbi:hemerythrin domain-containing protein [Streptomyces zaehneri]|uniref:hemerythrin domain-containing protein n=1 Tax=Streptomyces zaehneri TaxID=3051180 RepID=UPI0037D99F63
MLCGVVLRWCSSASTVCLAFCQALRVHHVSEDAHVFPTMARHRPDLAGAFARLTEQHRTNRAHPGRTGDPADGCRDRRPRALSYRTERCERVVERSPRLGGGDDGLPARRGPRPPAPPARPAGGGREHEE